MHRGVLVVVLLGLAAGVARAQIHLPSVGLDVALPDGYALDETKDGLDHVRKPNVTIGLPIMVGRVSGYCGDTLIEGLELPLILRSWQSAEPPAELPASWSFYDNRPDSDFYVGMHQSAFCRDAGGEAYVIVGEALRDMAELLVAIEMALPIATPPPPVESYETTEPEEEFSTTEVAAVEETPVVEPPAPVVDTPDRPSPLRHLIPERLQLGVARFGYLEQKEWGGVLTVGTTTLGQRGLGWSYRTRAFLKSGWIYGAAALTVGYSAPTISLHAVGGVSGGSGDDGPPAPFAPHAGAAFDWLPPFPTDDDFRLELGAMALWDLPDGDLHHEAEVRMHFSADRDSSFSLVVGHDRLVVGRAWMFMLGFTLLPDGEI